MKKIVAKLALLMVPVVLYFCWFAAFEPNNYFGLRKSAASTAPVARIKAYENVPGDSLILGDSRLAHFDMEQVDALSQYSWQNLAFGGASLRECIDLAHHCLDNSRTRRILMGLSFYTLNSVYDTDRMSALEDTLHNPLAYCFNLEYNVNAFTAFTDKLAGRQDTEETGDWVHPADYTDPATGEVYDVHTILAVYPKAIRGYCEKWSLNRPMLDKLYALADRCRAQGVQLVITMPPMADNVRALCAETGIEAAMYEALPLITAELTSRGVQVLDYEWSDPAAGVKGGWLLEDDRQYYDGFHLDTRYGLPVWVEDLFPRVDALLSAD